MQPPTASSRPDAGSGTHGVPGWLGGVCVVLFLLAFAAVALYRYQQLHDEAGLRLNRALRVAGEHALRVLDTNEALIARILDALGEDDDARLRAREPALHAQLREMARNRPQIGSLWVVDAQGRPLATTVSLPVPAHVSAADRHYFRFHQAHGGGLFVSEPFKGRATDAPTLSISRGRYRADGSFAGLVAVNLRPSYFEQFHDDLVAQEAGVAVNLLRRDGTILSRWPALENAPARLSPSGPVMRMIDAGLDSGHTVGVSSVDGRKRLLHFTRLGEHALYLGTGMDVADIQRRWMSEMAWLAAFGLPPLAGLLFALRAALRRGHAATQAALRLRQESDALRRVEEALLQAQKLEALGRITGGVAHDFNNALMVVSNNLYILQRALPEGPQQPQLASIGRAVESATKLTRQLLAFSRRQALVPARCLLQERLPALRDLLGPVLGSQITLSIAVDQSTAPVFIDASEFELAMINLAVNARDAQPAGGHFHIRARNATHDLPLLLHPPMVLVECEDGGTGIAPELLDKVFEPFFTTKPVGQGTGLGLSQVYGLCQRAGGLATLRSTPGRGTTVCLYLAPATDAAAAPADTPRSLPRHENTRVLLVEDNPEVSGALRPVLESLGCRVHAVPHAAAAIGWLQAQGQPPEWMLSDVVMPGEMDGVALARHARERFPTMRILLMSGYTDQLEAVTQLGFDILPKPCSVQMLAEALARPRPRPRPRLRTTVPPLPTGTP